MRRKMLTTWVMIAACGLVARAEPPADAPAPAPAPREDGRRVVGTLVTGDGVGEAGSTYEVLARDIEKPAKAAFIGVNTSSASPALQKQLQLPAGVGLVVDSFEAGSPADKAGVKEYDVLHKLDDQLLINSEQLGVLIRAMQPGKDVKLTVIREGESKVLTVKLGEREVPPMRLSFADGMLTMSRLDTVRGFSVDAVEPNQIFTGTLRLQTPDGKQELTAARITIENDKHKMTVSSPEGRKHLRVDDKEGKVLFDGPISTPQELEKVPAELRQAYTDILKDYSVEALPPPQQPPTPAPAPTPATTGVPRQR